MLNKVAVRDEDGFIVLVPRDEYMKKHNTKCAFAERVVDNPAKFGEHDIVPVENSSHLSNSIYATGTYRLTNIARYHINNVLPRSWIYRAWNIIEPYVKWDEPSKFAPHFDSAKYRDPFRHVLTIGVMLKVVMKPRTGSKVNIDCLPSAWLRTMAPNDPERKGFDQNPNRYCIIRNYDDYEHLFRAATDIFISRWRSYYDLMMAKSAREVYVMGKVLVVYDDMSCSTYYGNDALQQMWQKLEIHC